MREKAKIYPIILAAGDSSCLGFPKSLVKLGRKTALEIAVKNCSGMGRPIVVLGHQAAKVRAGVPGNARIVINRRWRSGQLTSLLAGLRCVPRDAPFMLYPVDYPLLTRALIRRIVAGYRKKREPHRIAAPVFSRRQGHPVIFSAELRTELLSAKTAREVVSREKKRVKLVPVGTPAIWKDFDSMLSYRRRLREFRRGSRQPKRTRPARR